MRTVDLVSLLAADAAPVAAKAVARRLALSVAWGLPLALLLMGLTLGPRSDLAQAALGGPFWMKVGFAACLAWAGFLAVERLGRPGMRVGGVWFALAAPLLLAWLVAARARVCWPDLWVRLFTPCTAQSRLSLSWPFGTSSESRCRRWPAPSWDLAGCGGSCRVTAGQHARG
jgi:hypothetical protein